MWRRGKTAAVKAREAKAEVFSRARLVPGETPTCCSQPMQPQLAHAHDRSGNSLFVTLWRCPQCGKAVC